MLQLARAPPKPFWRNAGTAALLFVGADAVAQFVEQESRTTKHDDTTTTTTYTAEPPSLDQWRCAGAVLLGVILGGGVYPTAYQQLERVLPGRSWRTVVLKSAVEIVTVGITVNTASLVGRAAWQGTHGAAQVVEHVATEIPRVTLMDARVWFPYNCVAFACIPMHVRPLTTAGMEAAWQTYISLRAHDFQQQEETSAKMV